MATTLLQYYPRPTPPVARPCPARRKVWCSQDLWSVIGTFLTDADRARCLSVCRRWRRVAGRPAVGPLLFAHVPPSREQWTLDHIRRWLHRARVVRWRHPRAYTICSLHAAPVLQCLELRSTPCVLDLRWLAPLKRLRQLIVVNCSMRCVPELALLTGLETLVLDSVRLHRPRLASLQLPPRLRQLTLDDLDRSWTDCPVVFTRCVGLRYLKLRRPRPLDLVGLDRCEQLARIVILAPYGWPRFPWLRGLPALTHLTVQAANLFDLWPVTTCPSLHTLDLSGSALRSLAPLDRVPSLRVLNLSNCTGPRADEVEALCVRDPPLDELRLPNTRLWLPEP